MAIIDFLYLKMGTTPCGAHKSQEKLLKQENPKKSSSNKNENIKNEDSCTNAVGLLSSRRNLIQEEQYKRDSFIKSIKERVRESAQSKERENIIGDELDIETNLNKVIEQFYEMKQTLSELESLLKQLTLLPEFRTKDFDKVITRYEENNRTLAHRYTPYMRQIHALGYKRLTQQVHQKFRSQKITKIQKLNSQIIRLTQQKTQLNQSLKQIKEQCEQQLQIQTQILEGEKKRKQQLKQEIEELKNHNAQLTKKNESLQRKLNTINLSLINLRPQEPRRRPNIPPQNSS